MHPLQAVPRSFTATEVVGVLQRSGTAATVWMSQQALLAEVQSLRRDLAELSLRVLALESRDLGEPAESAGRSAPASPLVINYTGGGAALPLPPFPSGSQATPSSPPCSTWQSPSSTNSPPAVLTDAERRRIAEEAGRFLRPWQVSCEALAAGSESGFHPGSTCCSVTSRETSILRLECSGLGLPFNHW